MNRYRAAREVGVIASDDVVYVARLPDGPITVLEGVAAVIWREACRDDATPLLGRVAAQVELPGDGGAEVTGFVDDLVARGLLERL